MNLANVNKIFPTLQQRKFMSTFRAFSHSALNRRWAARTSKCSAICYVKGETTFWTIQYMLRRRTSHSLLLLNQAFNEILKIFLRLLRLSRTEILTITKTVINNTVLNAGSFKYDVGSEKGCRRQIK